MNTVTREAPASRPNAVVFDIGNVLIEWDPRHLYRKMFDGDEARVEHFIDNVCTMAWNLEQDRGRSWADAVAALAKDHPEWRAEIEAYDKRWSEMVPGEIAGTVTILQKLREAGVPTYAITNFSTEKFVEATERFPFLAGFDGIVVSGEVRLLKPDPAIFHLFLENHGLAAGDCIFVDDSLRNVESARALGMWAHHFTEPEDFARELKALGFPV